MKFSDFKKNRSKLADTVENLKSRDSKPNYSDERFWDVTKDAAGNGEAIIRFLPQPSLEKAPTVKLLSHGFQEKGRWFIEDCPASIGKECPVCEKAMEVYAGVPQGVKIKNPYYKKTKFIACILVVKDPGKPENNGKIKLYAFGKKINDKIMTAVAPDSDLVDAINVFDMWEGANFHIRVTKQQDWPNYDTSSFKEVSPIAKKDSEIEKIYEQIISLDEFEEEKRFKSYDDLYAKLTSMLTIGGKTNERKPDARTEKDNKGSGKSTTTETDSGSDDEDTNVDFDSLIDDDSNDDKEDESSDDSDEMPWD